MKLILSNPGIVAFNISLSSSRDSPVRFGESVTLTCTVSNITILSGLVFSTNGKRVSEGCKVYNSSLHNMTCREDKRQFNLTVWRVSWLEHGRWDCDYIGVASSIRVEVYLAGAISVWATPVLEHVSSANLGPLAPAVAHESHRILRGDGSRRHMFDLRNNSTIQLTCQSECGFPAVRHGLQFKNASALILEVSQIEQCESHRTFSSVTSTVAINCHDRSGLVELGCAALLRDYQSRPLKVAEAKVYIICPVLSAVTMMMSASNASNSSELICSSFCVEITSKRIYTSNIKYFDVFLLLPTLAFFVFLVLHCRKMLKRVFSNSSAIITTFYVLLFLGCSVKVVRALVVMTLNSEDEWVQIVDKALWLVVRFFLLATEMSIITFGVAAARLDSQAGIRRVLLVTSCISLTYTMIQALLEFGFPDRRFHGKTYSMYGHGGALFFFVSSLFLLLVYCSVLLLPLTRCSSVLRLPTKRMFYVYCSLLATLYALEAVGSMLFYCGIESGLCMISICSLVYFVCYDPLVFATFLHNYFKSRRVLAFKYAQHTGEFPDTSEEVQKRGTRHLQDERGGSREFSVSSGGAVCRCGGKSDCRCFGSGDEEDGSRLERSTHFYPDQLVTVERDQNDTFTIHEILKRFNILSAGARLDYASRHPSSVSAAAEPTLPLEDGRDEIDGSLVLSLSDDGVGDLVNPGPDGIAWDMQHFASQRRK